MENRREHAQNIKHNNNGTLEEILQKFKGNRSTRDAFDVETQIANVPDKEYYQEPSRPTLKGKIPVANVTVIARVILRLHSNIDTINAMK